MDSKTFTFNVDNAADLLLENTAKISEKFHCQNVPWYLVFESKLKNGKLQIGLYLNCDYKAVTGSKWSIKTDYELRILSQLEGIEDKVNSRSKYTFKKKEGLYESFVLGIIRDILI
jgi:hypothetical protein